MQNTGDQLGAVRDKLAEIIQDEALDALDPLMAKLPEGWKVDIEVTPSGIDVSVGFGDQPDWTRWEQEEA
jgi:hypothetical protein